MESLNLKNFFSERDLPNEVLSVFYFSDDYKLVINSIRNTFILISNSNMEKIKSNVISEEAFLKIKETLYPTRLIEQEKKRTVSYNICPTYACNMKCPYCYQQTFLKSKKSILSMENLEQILMKIRDQKIVKKDFFFQISLFGGEPLLKINKDRVRRILRFCQEERIPLSITSNGLGISHYHKELLVYKGFINRICITLDGPSDIHNKQRPKVNGDGSFFDIINNINFLLKIGIKTTVAVNVDKTNIQSLSQFFKHSVPQEWINHPSIEFQIGRVDDRLFELPYKEYLSESELLIQLERLKKENIIPTNSCYAFLKSCFSLCQLMKIENNQNEYGRLNSSYCWATSDLSECYYIDPDLDIFRCTYSVGKKEFRIGNFNKFEQIKKDQQKFNLYNIRQKCLNCPIAGHCGGGCFLSCSVNEERFCQEEIYSYNNFVNEVFVPYLKQNSKACHYVY